MEERISTAATRLFTDKPTTCKWEPARDTPPPPKRALLFRDRIAEGVCTHFCLFSCGIARISVRYPSCSGGVAHQVGHVEGSRTESLHIRREAKNPIARRSGYRRDSLAVTRNTGLLRWELNLFWPAIGSVTATACHSSRLQKPQTWCFRHHGGKPILRAGSGANVSETFTKFLSLISVQRMARTMQKFAFA